MTANNQSKEKPTEDQKNNRCEMRKIYIQIGENGKINAWGLDQNSEEIILERTGNQNLVKRQQKMSYILCG